MSKRKEELDLSIDHERGLRIWREHLAQALEKNTALFKHFVGVSKPYTFKEIETKARKKIALLEKIKKAKTK